MTVTVKAFGTTVTETSNPLIAIGGGFTDRRGRLRRLPMAVLKTVERVAGSPSPLTADEMSSLALLDMAVVDATPDVLRAKAYTMLSNGMTQADINHQLSNVPKHYRLEEPTGPITYFTPAR